MLNRHVTIMNNNNAKNGNNNSSPNNNNVLPSCSNNNSIHNNVVVERYRTTLRARRRRDVDALSLLSAGRSCAVDSVTRSFMLPLGARFVIVAWLCCVFTAVVVGAQPQPLNYYNTNEDKRANFEREFLNFGKRASDAMGAADPSAMSMQRNFMSFGKRAASVVGDNEFGRQFMPFGKRATLADLVDAGAYDAREPLLGVYTKKNFDRQFLPFGKREAAGGRFQRDFMAFGRRRK